MEKFQLKNLENSQNQLPTIQDTSSISIYHGKLTKKGLVIQTERILIMFPKFQPMLEELKNAFAENGFNNQRMIASVNNVRDTFQGWNRLPSVADFIQFDKAVKIYTYNEVCEKTTKYNKFWDSMIGIDFNGELRYADKIEVEKYNIKKWNYK